jgi:quercetin dioxygenase-like cupin family protein
VYVLAGELELFGDREATLSAGDSFVVGPGVRHGIRGVAPESAVVDAFAPPIAEYARR